MIDIHRLNILSEVARHNSFAKAAGALRCTPSAVSQQIAALERTVGTAVVRRSSRGVSLTDPGRLLVEAREAIAAELDHARAQIARLATAQASLAIATFSSGGRRLLPSAIRRLHTDHPALELTILEHEPEESLPLVRAGHADIAVAYHYDGPPPVRPGDRSGLNWTPLLIDPLLLVLPDNHPLAGAATVHLADLAAERWVLGCLKTAALLHQYAAVAGFDPRIACRSTDYFFAASMVSAGAGISLIPRIALDQIPPGVAVVPLAPPSPARHVGIVTARRRRPNGGPYLGVVTDALRDAASRVGADQNPSPARGVFG